MITSLKSRMSLKTIIWNLLVAQRTILMSLLSAISLMKTRKRRKTKRLRKRKTL